MMHANKHMSSKNRSVCQSQFCPHGKHLLFGPAIHRCVGASLFYGVKCEFIGKAEGGSLINGEEIPQCCLLRPIQQISAIEKVNPITVTHIVSLQLSGGQARTLRHVRV